MPRLHGSRQWQRRIVGALVVGVCLVSCSSGSGTAPDDAAELPDGPILNRPEHGYILADSAKGRVFTDGFETLEVTGDLPVVIDEITLDGAADSLELVGALLAGPDRGVGIIQRVEGFPPEQAARLGKLRPAVGATLQPASTLGGTQDYELLLGLRVLSDGADLRRGT